MGKSGKVAVPHWDDNPVLKAENLGDLVMRRQAAKDLMDKKKKELDDLNAEISMLLVVAKQEKVQVEEWIVSRVPGRSASSISGPKLVQRGVDPDIIKECTIPGTPYVQLRITPVKVQGGEVGAGVEG